MGCAANSPYASHPDVAFEQTVLESQWIDVTRPTRPAQSTQPSEPIDPVTEVEKQDPSVPSVPDRPPVDPISRAEFEKRARENYEIQKKAIKKYQAEFGPPDPALEEPWVIAIYDYADLTNNDRLRASLAEEGMEVCKNWVERNPSSAFAHYYLALNTGQLARTRGLTALRLVREMEASLHQARALDPTLDFGGPHRTLGQLYLDAPGWPTSIGSRQKARHHLEQAVELVPDHVSNRLAYAEALVEWRQYSEASAQVKKTLEIWDDARKRLNTPDWDDEWVSWTQRLEHLKQRLSRTRWPVSSHTRTPGHKTSSSLNMRNVSSTLFA
jgi:tetratricopeptide (TPR) repeat protein